MHALQQNKDLGSASDLLNIGFNPSESLITTQVCVWAVTHRHYRISALDIQTLFCGEIPIPFPAHHSFFHTLHEWSPVFETSNYNYCQTQKTVNTRKISGMLIVYWLITVKFSIREQTSIHNLITVALCGLVISRLIGLFLATQKHSINSSGVHGYVSFTVTCYYIFLFFLCFSVSIG